MLRGSVVVGGGGAATSSRALGAPGDSAGHTQRVASPVLQNHQMTGVPRESACVCAGAGVDAQLGADAAAELQVVASRLQRQLGQQLQEMMQLAGLVAVAASPPAAAAAAAAPAPQDTPTAPGRGEAGGAPRVGRRPDVLVVGSWSLQGAVYQVRVLRAHGVEEDGCTNHFGSSVTTWRWSGFGVPWHVARHGAQGLAASAWVRRVVSGVAERSVQVLALQHVPGQAAASALQLLLQEQDAQGAHPLPPLWPHLALATPRLQTVNPAGARTLRRKSWHAAGIDAGLMR